MRTYFVFESRRCYRLFVPLMRGPKCKCALCFWAFFLASLSKSFCKPMMWFPHALGIHGILMPCAYKHWFSTPVRICCASDSGPSEHWILPQICVYMCSVALCAGSMLTLCLPPAQVVSMNVPSVGTLSRLLSLPLPTSVPCVCMLYATSAGLCRSIVPSNHKKCVWFEPVNPGSQDLLWLCFLKPHGC